MKPMTIVLATGIYPPDVGGSAYYAKSLVEAFGRQNIQVKIKTYTLEKRLPTGIRHIYYAVRLLPAVLGSQGIIALDTFSVGLPAVLVGRLLHKKVIIRVGGDFLWEQYVERTRKPVILRTFYTSLPLLTSKEKLIFWVTKKTLQLATTLVFSTKWQAKIWQGPYQLNDSKITIIENHYTEIKDINPRSSLSNKKVFLWAGRSLYLKNISKLTEAVAEAQVTDSTIELKLLTSVSQEVLFEEIKKAYVVVVPSLSEVSPNLALEAIMYHTPVIVTAENGL